MFNAQKVSKKADRTLTLKEWESGSYLIMGFANFVNRQFARGAIFLAVEIAYIIFMIQKGFGTLGGLITLGTKKQGWATVEGSKIPVLQKGDNSMLFMIYGVAILVLTGIFITIYLANLSDARKLVKIKKSGKRPSNIIQDVKSLSDNNFHITLMSLPVLGILIFTLLPIIFMIMIAFTNYDGSHQVPGNLFRWVGLVNFKNILGGNALIAGTFFPVLGWTLVWAGLSTFSNYILGIIVALMINKKGIKLKAMWRTILVLTIALPQFITLLVMRNMFDPYGPVNQLLVWLGGEGARMFFFENVMSARITVLFVNLWIGIPYTMLITSGILMNIPGDMYEAAKIDGASPIQIFIKITMPYVIFVTMPYLITQFIGNLNNFNVIFLLTGGGPDTSAYYGAGKTDLLVTWLYKLTANVYDYNLASTIGILVFIISAAFSLVAYQNTTSYKKEDQFS
jgi:arabinogalactan oligomer/maltooligosaccharide transport system permease protein